MFLFGIRSIIGFFLAFGLLFFSVFSAEIEEYNDISNYETYFNTTIQDEENSQFHYLSEEMFEIFPKSITADMHPEEFKLIYYNPWDPQFVTYLTVDYEPDYYEEELGRLQQLGIEEYTDYYTVTGEPQGYDIIAMNSDDYHGFVYAMVPEGKENNSEITYVGIWFCNYVLDLDIHDHLPDKYLLQGFDASSGNPYEREKMGNH